MSPPQLHSLSIADTDSEQDFLPTPIDMSYDTSGFPYPMAEANVHDPVAHLAWVAGGSDVPSSPLEWYPENGSATALNQFNCGPRTGPQLSSAVSWSQPGYESGVSGLSRGPASRSGTASASHYSGANFGDQRPFDQPRTKNQSRHTVPSPNTPFDVYPQVSHTKMSRHSPTHLTYPNPIHDENMSNAYVGPSSSPLAYPQGGLDSAGLGYRQPTNYDAHYVQSSSGFHHAVASGLPPTQIFSHGSSHSHRRHTVSTTNTSPNCPYTYPHFNDADNAGIQAPQPHSWSFPAGHTDTSYLVSADDWPLSGITPVPRRSPPLVEDTPKRPLTLACLFCRKRKIACGSPPPGRTDKTCNQCARRNLKCVFPDASRRGMRPRLYEKDTSVAIANVSPSS